jgi:hypothetical protein
LERRGAKSLRGAGRNRPQRDQFVPKVQIWSWSRQQWVTDLPSIRMVEKQV